MIKVEDSKNDTYLPVFWDWGCLEGLPLIFAFRVFSSLMIVYVSGSGEGGYLGVCLAFPLLFILRVSTVVYSWVDVRTNKIRETLLWNSVQTSLWGDMGRSRRTSSLKKGNKNKDINGSTGSRKPHRRIPLTARRREPKTIKM